MARRRSVELSSSDEIAIGMAWHSTGAGNLGVGALTVGNLIAARSAAAAIGLTPRFTIIQPVTDVTGGANIAGEDVEVFNITGKSMVSPSGYMSLLGRLDCILDIGAGDSFADIYGGKRFTYIYGTKLLANMRRVPVVLSPQTIGPFTRQPYRALARQAMEAADCVVARDPQSLRAIKDIAPSARAIQSVDVAFRLPFTRPQRAPGGPVEVGVNVSGLLFNGGYTSRNEFGLEVDYAELMRRFIGELVSRPGVRVHLISHVTSTRMPHDDDGRVADRLIEEFPAAIRAPDFTGPSEAKSYIAGLDFLVAGRMHACIAAYSAGVPVVPIAYSRKFSGLFGDVLGYPHQVPVSGLSTDEAYAFLLARFEARQELAGEVREGMRVVDGLLDAYDAELRRLFLRAKGRSGTTAAVAAA
jgi:polysaccharide pyruvyl transferase WcaK-like protein